MSAPVNYWKLGLFASLGMAVAFFALVALGASKFDEVRLGFVTYFDESVSGLEVGSSVKFRGAPIGRVDGILIASDGRHVKVECSVNVAALKALGLQGDQEKNPSVPQGEFVPPDLRTQLVSAALTGTKFVQIDFFEAKTHPTPGLPFPTPKNYIPATPSTLASLETSITGTAAELPGLLKQGKGLLTKLEAFIDKIDVKQLNDRGLEALTEARDLLKEGRADLKKMDLAGLSKRGGTAIDKATGAIERTDKILARVEAKGGVLEDVEQTVKDLRADLKQLKIGTRAASAIDKLEKTLAAVERTANAFTETAKSNRHLGADVGKTLTELRRAARSLRKLADTIERDSDMLLKGRAKKK